MRGRKWIAGAMVISLLAGGFVLPAEAALPDTTWGAPTKPRAVDEKIVKVGIHAAASTTAFFLGGNVVAERVSDYHAITSQATAQAKYDAALQFTRLGAFGSSANIRPDPYLWNYFYNLAVDAGQASGEKSADEVYISAGAASPMSSDVTVVDSLGTSYTLARRPEVLMDKAGGYANLIAQLPENTDSDSGNDYTPISLDYKANNFADLVDDMYNLSDAIKASGKAGRYGDTDAIAQKYEAYIKGLQYYLIKQIDKGKLDKKNVAVITTGVDTDQDGKTDSYVCVNSKIAVGVSTDRPSESIMYTSNNIMDVKPDLGTFDIVTTSRGQTTTSTETVATLAQLAEMDAIIFGGHVINQADTLVSEMKAAGISEDKIPPIYDNDPSDVFTIRANSVENFAGIGIYNGWLYPQVINPVDVTMYIYKNFWHLKDSELRNFAQANFAGASLPAGITTDGSGYDEAAIDAMIREGLRYGAGEAEEYEDTTLALSNRLTNYDVTPEHFEYTWPTKALSVDANTLTTLTQRAASEIPLIFGINVMGGNMFNGLQFAGGTDVNENPDPYIYNYNYLQGTKGAELPAGAAYQALGNDVGNANGLYQTGGSNMVYVNAQGSYGGLGYAVGMRSDIIFSFNSGLISQINTVRGFKSGDKYYQVGDENYAPVLADVQTGSVSSRLYSWSESGKAISKYLAAHPDKNTRYEDPEIVGKKVEEFSAGIPYYIASLIADGSIRKKTMAYVSKVNDEAFTCVDPNKLGDVRSDCYGEVRNFNFIEGTYTMEQLLAKQVDIITLNTSYSYASTTAAGTGEGSSSTGKKAILQYLAEVVGCSADEMPLVMDADTSGVTVGNNGYNYATTTPMFMPYIQTYAYMDELAEVNKAINPVAMVEFMLDECFHIKEENAKEVALYYIGSKWDSVDKKYDRVPDQKHYTYDKEAIEKAIRTGAAYALSGDAAKNGNTLIGAYSTADTAYKLLNGDLSKRVYQSKTDPSVTKDRLDRNDNANDYTEVIIDRTGYLLSMQPSGKEGTDWIKLNLDGKTTYLDLNKLKSFDDNTGATSDIADGSYSTTTQSFAAIIAYYNQEGGVNADLATTLQTYADRMHDHVWIPETTVKGTYAYGVTSEPISGSRIAGDANDDGTVNGLDLICMKQYFAGYDVSLDQSNADVTGDGKVNGLDVIRMCQYFAGYDVALE